MPAESFRDRVDEYRRGLLAAAAGSWVSAIYVSPPAFAATARGLDEAAEAALQRLYAAYPKARDLSMRAKGVLIFPKVTKAGLIIGGQEGEGALRVSGATKDYYRIASASLGPQAGAQTFGFAMFFITQSALDYLGKSDGWSIGAGPSVVLADSETAKTMNTTTLNQDVYAMAFGQKGLMAATGLEGTKISPFHPGP